MKSLFYIVSKDKIVFTIKDSNKTKTLFLIRDDSELFDWACTDWNGTVVSAIRSLLFKLNIKFDVCMIETINASPDCVWDWKQKHLVHINSSYSFMWVMKNDADAYHDWEMLNRVMEKLGYVVEGWEYEVEL